MFSDSKIDVKFVCGVTSTTITGPKILPKTNGGKSYIMIAPSTFYALKSFTSSNSDCPIETVEIAPIMNGTDLDYTSSDGV